MTKYVVMFLTAVMLFSCKDDEAKTVDGTSESFVTVNFTHDWDGQNITAEDFNQFSYTNAHGELLSLTRYRYLVSNLKLTAENGEQILLKDFNLVDVTNTTDLSFVSQNKVKQGTYSLSFVFGFNEVDNDINHIALNSVSWNWPDMLGGGYHFLQMEGKYTTDQGNTTDTYAYHMGTARVSSDTFEANHFEVTIGQVDVGDDYSITINSNIAEWFRNPIEWDLTQYNNMLMPNYDAQIMMHQNGPSVFSITQ